MNTRTRIIAVSTAVIVAVLMTAVLLKPRRPEQQPGPKPPKTALPSKKPYKGSIAIVIDDVGYNAANLELLRQIHVPMTLSVLPNLDFSTEAGEHLHKKFEIILHLPMEPKAVTGLEADTILAGMDAEKIRSIISRDLADIKYARGVSNHMGSKVTEDPATMALICAELKQRKMYFLDSFVTPKSVGRAAAAAAGITFARRDVFLDNQSDPESIRQQLLKLKQKAAANGSAIGIGHDRKNTLEVLKKELPAIEAEGYKFVTISRLLSKTK